MNSLINKIRCKFLGLKPKKKSARNVYSKHGKIVQMGNGWNEYRNIITNSCGHFADLNIFCIRLEDYLRTLDIPGEFKVSIRSLPKPETESCVRIWQEEEEDAPSKIRYTQKLFDIDRRIRVLEQERWVDKKLHLGQTRQLEYLEADVASLKKREKALPDQENDVGLAEGLSGILENVQLMEEMRDEPVEFQQARATFLSQVRALESQKKTREPYFTDLLTMIDVGLTYADETELTEESFSVLRDAVRCASSEVTNDTLRELRKRFRDNGINILKPLNPQAGVGELLKETFKNELTA